MNLDKSGRNHIDLAPVVELSSALKESRFSSATPLETRNQSELELKAFQRSRVGGEDEKKQQSHDRMNMYKLCSMTLKQ